jgi:hypothetical protein
MQILRKIQQNLTKTFATHNTFKENLKLKLTISCLRASKSTSTLKKWRKIIFQLSLFQE